MATSPIDPTTPQQSVANPSFLDSPEYMQAFGQSEETVCPSDVPGSPSQTVAPALFQGYSTDGTDSMANNHDLFIEIYGVHAKKTIRLKAMLNAWDDQFRSDLASEVLVGHPEPLKKVKTIERIISIGLDVVAGSTAEAKRNLEALSMLVKMLHPVSEKEMSAGIPQKYVKSGGDPLFKIKFLNFIVDGNSAGVKSPSAKESGLKGYIDGLSYSFNMDAGFFWDQGKEGIFYPSNISLQFNYHPFNDVTPGWFIGEDGAPEFSHRHVPYALNSKGNQTARPTPTGTPEASVTSPGATQGIDEELNAAQQELDQRAYVDPLSRPPDTTRAVKEAQVNEMLDDDGSFWDNL